MSDDSELWVTAGEPLARIEQTGRFTYRIVVVQGIMAWGPGGYGWTVWGRKRAERKAHRVLERYRRNQARQAAAWTVS